MFLVKRIEGMKEFFLCLHLAADELHVVHHQNVCEAVLLVELILLSLPYRLDQLIGKLVALDVHDLFFREFLVDGVLNGKKKMCLAHAGVAVNEKRIVGAAGILRHGKAGGMRKFVGRADDKRVEGILVEGIVRRRIHLPRRNAIQLVGD